MLWLLACQKEVLDAEITVDGDVVAYPADVTFTASAPIEGVASWEFGEGGTATGDEVTHRFVGAGTFDVTLTVTDARGDTAVATVAVILDAPGCPTMHPPELTGVVSDLALNELSGIAPSLRATGLSWVHQDNGDNPLLFAVDPEGRVRGRYDIHGIVDFEDIATAADPETGAPLLFVGDIGDNDLVRDEIAVVMLDEPDPNGIATAEGLRMALNYPADPPYDAETLLVDPLTLDLFVVTKDRTGASRVFVKRGPHDEPGPFLLEELTRLSFAVGGLEGLTTTAGDVSPDGTRFVIRAAVGWHVGCRCRGPDNLGTLRRLRVRHPGIERHRRGSTPCGPDSSALP